MENKTMISVKNFLVRKLAVDMMVIPEKTIEAVINYQFSTAFAEMDRSNSIEISGFGRFVFSVNKAKKKIKQLEAFKKYCQEDIDNEQFSEKKRRSATLRMEALNADLEYVNRKLNEI